MEPKFKIGAAEISRIHDLSLEVFTPQTLLPNAPTAEMREAVSKLPERSLAADREHIVLSIHSWLVQHNGRNILIDTGSGNSKPRPHAKYFDMLKTNFIENLATAGITPDEVDYVLSTHLHVDHVGWNTRLQGDRWVPTFPNARYIFSRAEYEYFTDPANNSERNRTSFEVQKDSVTPVVDAGLADLIDVNGREVIENFSFHLTPGHTKNHAVIVFKEGEDSAIFSGDVVHHPIQIAHPEWSSVFDAYTEEAVQSRRWTLDLAARTQAKMFTAHFPSTAAGVVCSDGAAFAWSWI